MKRSAVVLLVPLVLYAGFSVRLKLQLLDESDSDAPIESGTEALPIVLEDLNGHRYDLTEVIQEKQVVVVNFWATWCGPCKIEMPQFEELYEEHGTGGLEILAITREDREVVEEFLKTRNYSFPILLDPGGEVTERYGVEALPTTVLVDRDGKVISSRNGIDPFLDRQIPRLLRSAASDQGEEEGEEEGNRE